MKLTSTFFILISLMVQTMQAGNNDSKCRATEPCNEQLIVKKTNLTVETNTPKPSKKDTTKKPLLDVNPDEGKKPPYYFRHRWKT